MRADRTLPFDIALAVRLAQPAGTMSSLAEELAVVPSQVHAALGRLERAGLLRPTGRATNTRALGEFLNYGLRYAFPARRGPLTRGVPTAHSAPALAKAIDAPDVVVWPAPDAAAAVAGFEVAPLYAGAVRLPETSPDTYRVLTILDALRLGDRRARGFARELLAESLGIPKGVA
ncbi:MAG: hypothetical protein KJZ74_12795 [Gemmatimonadales bacterium]|nr:hypothetical protein [Gemmatimonadales bacterium]